MTSEEAGSTTEGKTTENDPKGKEEGLQGDVAADSENQQESVKGLKTLRRQRRRMSQQ